MSNIINRLKTSALLPLVVVVVFLSACNKDLPQYSDPVPPTPSGLPLADLIKANPDDSFYYKLVVKGNMVPVLNNKTTTYTAFVPNNTGMKQFISIASGGLIPVNAPDAVFDAFISTQLSAASCAAIVQYYTIPQKVSYAQIPTTFPNFQYPSLFNPQPSLSALLRLTNFPSRRDTKGWLNNLPITGPDNLAYNGVMHQIATILPPPSQYVWNRITLDTSLSLLTALVQRADQGRTTIEDTSIIAIASSIGANLTVFAPNNNAIRVLINMLSGGAIPVGAPESVFVDFINNLLPVQNARGIVAYHVLTSRAFTSNLPATATPIPTFFNAVIPAHPGITVTVTSYDPSGYIVTAATVKGLGNPTASDVLVNPLPFPAGTSDQHCLNGVLHKINQVLLPQ